MLFIFMLESNPYLERPEPVVHDENPCIPTPCGPNSQCRSQNNLGVCTCLPNYIGRPPSCRPECTVNSDCASNLACINEKCKNPCRGSCGYNTDCQVISHQPQCTCHPGFIGDPFSGCREKPQCKIESPLTTNLTPSCDLTIILTISSIYFISLSLNYFSNLFATSKSLCVKPLRNKRRMS